MRRTSTSRAAAGIVNPRLEQVSLSKLANFFHKQQLAWESSFLHRYVFYGGARGPGKSRFLRWWLVMRLLYWFAEDGLRHVRVGLFSKTYPTLRDRQISYINTEMPHWLGEVRTTQEDGLCFFLRDDYGGGRMALRSMDDPSKYQSFEAAAIGIEELTEIDYSTFAQLRGSLRWPGVERTVFMGAGRPGGIGHGWVKQLWIDRQFPPELIKPKDLRPEFDFIPALPDDNPYLSETYWQDLESLPEKLKRAWRYGDWNVFAGQAFSDWIPTLHVSKPVHLPAAWRRWVSVDWGYANPWCALWWAQDPDCGRLFIYRELYQTELTDRAQAKLIKQWCEGENIWKTYADPSMWARKNVQDIVTTTYDEYLAEGVSLSKADNDRLSGKRKLHRALALLSDGLPGLIVFETCSNFIRTVPSLPSDPDKPEDVDSNAEDHAYDATRYGLTPLLVKPAQPKGRIVAHSPLEGMKGL